MKLLIDGDPIVYRAGFAAEQKFYQGVTEYPDGDITTFHVAAGADYRQYKELQAMLGNRIVYREPIIKAEPLAHALHLVNMQLEYIREQVKPLTESIFLTGPNNFREKYATIRPYKGNRDPLHKPVHYKAIRDFLIAQRGARLIHGRESDDEVSILAHAARADSQPYCVATIDKDLDQIPGLHYDYRQHVFYTVSPEDAERALWIQILAGDGGDNVPGCYKTGTIRAAKLVDHAFAQGFNKKALWAMVVGEYATSQRKPGCPYKDVDPEKVALETARLVYILRAPGELWFPDGPLICEGEYDD